MRRRIGVRRPHLVVALGAVVVVLVGLGVVVVTSGDGAPDVVELAAVDRTTSSTAPEDPTTTSATATTKPPRTTTTTGAPPPTTTGSPSTGAPTTGAPTTGRPPPAPSPPPPPAPPSAPPPPPGLPPLANIGLRLTSIGTFAAPTAMVPRPGTGELWVAERAGRVVAVGRGVVLDMSGSTRAEGERGLLGLAFAPAGDRLYLSYTDVAGDTNLDEYVVRGDGSVDAATRRPVFDVIDQPYPNHNGGGIVLGPDGALWLGLGDGGSAGDPEDRAQNPGTPLGKLLRILPGGFGWEIVASGLRNPWRFSFDRANGDLWLADVGQNRWEEIDRVPFGAVRGADFAWDRMEGTHPFEGGPEPGDITPVWEYDHGQGCSVTGGFLYRGNAIPGLRGTYLYGDFCAGVVHGLRLGGDGRVAEERSFGLPVPQLASFAEDTNGELYALSLGGPVYRIDPA